MKTIFEDFRLDGKVVWVAGAAGYLGTPVVKILLEAGADVVAIDVNDRAIKMKSAFPDSKYAPKNLDITNFKEVQEFVKNEAGNSGIPDALVNLTYASTSRNFYDLSEKEFDLINHNGLTATFLLAREVGQLMEKRRNGAIVLFSSMYGSVSPDPAIYEGRMNVNPVEYGVGKAGIVQLTRYLAVHWAKKGIRVNCISPGPFPNEKVKEEDPGFIERLSNKVPLGRIGKQKEIAAPVLFLISDASSFITGHNLFVDGGWTTW